MSENTKYSTLNGIARRAQAFFLEHETVEVAGDGNPVQTIVVDLCEAVRTELLNYLAADDGSIAVIRRETTDLGETLNPSMVAAWDARFGKEMQISEADQAALARAVVYCVEQLWENPELEALDFDRMALEINLETVGQSS